MQEVNLMMQTVIKADKTVALLRFDTGYQDAANPSRAWTKEGTLSIDSTVKKFGTASLKSISVGGSITTSDSPELHLPGDWTIDFWLYNLGISGQNNGQVILHKNLGNVGSMIDIDNGAMGLYNNSLIIGAPAAQMVYNAWVHWEFSREGNLYRLFKNGVLVTQVTAAGNTIWDNPAYMRVGNYINGNNPVNGNLDDFRISRVCRHTANFTPNTSPHVVD